MMGVVNRGVRNEIKQSHQNLRELDDVCSVIENGREKKGEVLVFTTYDMLMATLPHNNPNRSRIQRENGKCTVSMTANTRYGLPYGSPPRLWLAAIINEVKQTKSPVLRIGKIYSRLLRNLKLSKFADKRDDEAYLYDQMLRLFSTSISYANQNKNEEQYSDEFAIHRKFDFWWNPLKGNRENITSSSTIVITNNLFYELMKFPDLVNFKILQEICHSPMLIDIYVWLVYRLSYFKWKTLIPWSHLITQFDPNYTGNTQNLKEFKEQLLKAIYLIIGLYQKVNVEVQDNGIILNLNCKK
jgi:hypothetical protein